MRACAENLPGHLQPGVELRDVALVLAGALRLRKLADCAPVKPVIGRFLAVGQGGKVIEPEVDAHAAIDRTRGHVRDLYRDVEGPVAARVLGEAGPVLDLAVGQRATAEHAKCVARKAERITLALKVAPLDRNPSKGLAAAIAQVRPHMLAARLRILLARRVDRARVDAECLATAGRQHVEVEACWPLLAPLQRVFLRVVAEIPDVIHRAALLVQQAVQRFHPVAVDKNHVADFNVRMPPAGGAPFTPRPEEAVAKGINRDNSAL